KICSSCQAVHVVDVDKDGQVDLVITGVTGTPEAGNAEMYVAYSRGDGNFSSSPDKTKTADNHAAPYLVNYFPIVPIGRTDPAEEHAHDIPLAVGHLNQDCALDFVTSAGIYLSVADPGTCEAPDHFFSMAGFEEAHYWTSATIVDLTHDGIPDV